MEGKGKASTKAKNKYNAANYEQILFAVKKGTKAVYKAAADAVDMSLGGYIQKAVEEKMKREENMRLAEDFKNAITSHALTKGPVTCISINTFVFEDLKTDPSLAEDLMEWFPQKEWTFRGTPIKVVSEVNKWFIE